MFRSVKASPFELPYQAASLCPSSCIISILTYQVNYEDSFKHHQKCLADYPSWSSRLSRIRKMPQHLEQTGKP